MDELLYCVVVCTFYAASAKVHCNATPEVEGVLSIAEVSRHNVVETCCNTS